jgi:phage-related protein
MDCFIVYLYPGLGVDALSWRYKIYAIFRVFSGTVQSKSVLTQLVLASCVLLIVEKGTVVTCVINLTNVNISEIFLKLIDHISYTFYGLIDVAKILGIFVYPHKVEVIFTKMLSKLDALCLQLSV